VGQGFLFLLRRCCAGCASPVHCLAVPAASTIGGSFFNHFRQLRIIFLFTSINSSSDSYIHQVTEICRNIAPNCRLSRILRFEAGALQPSPDGNVTALCVEAEGDYYSL
jgi:hypothetical protein